MGSKSSKQKRTGRKGQHAAANIPAHEYAVADPTASPAPVAAPGYGVGAGSAQGQLQAAPAPAHVHTHGMQLQLEGAGPVEAAPLPPPKARDPRTCRVFFSSTFRDMHPERDELLRSAVPRVRALLAQRGVFFVPVDLRWGITEAGAKDGNVTLLCLREVQASNYFIAFLKARYGWHQDPSAPQDALFARNLERAAGEFPFVRGCGGQSVTEVEIRAGALNDPRAAQARSAFFFASPAAMARDTENAEGPYARQRLAALKEEIRRAGLRVWQPDYTTPQELAESIYAALAQWIERDFPARVTGSWLDEERASHAAFAAPRERVYVRNPADFSALDRHVDGASVDPLVVFGPSGCGKSSLLANWAGERRRRQPSEGIVLHFVGSSAGVGQTASLLRRLREEVEAAVEEPPPLAWDLSDAYASAATGLFAAWLPRAAGGLRGRRLVLAVDGLDQLPREAQGLAWLPQLPAGCPLRIVLAAAAPSAALEAARARPHGALEVLPLDPPRRRALIRADLEAAGKELEAGQVERLASAPAAASAVWLTMVVDQLKIGAVHETLGALLEAYLKTTDAVGVARRTLDRWAAAYGQDLVRETAGALLCCRAGASEAELMAFVGVAGAEGPPSKAGGRVEPVAWAVFWSAAQPFLVNRGGVHGFFHASVARAAEGLLDAAEGTPGRARWCARLGRFFAGLPPSERRSDEAPYLLARGGPECRPLLVALLGEAGHLLHAARDDARMWDLIGDWTACGAADSAAAAYRGALAAWEGPTAGLLHQNAMNLLRKMGRPREAVPFGQRAMEIYEAAAQAAGMRGEMAESYASIVGDVASIYVDLHESLDYAVALYRHAIEISEREGGADNPGALTHLNNLAYALAHAGQREEARATHERVLRARETTLGPSHPKVAETLNNLSVLEEDLGNYATAEAHQKRAIAIKEAAYGKDHPSISANHSNLASVYRKLARYPECEQLQRRVLAADERTLGPSHPEVATDANNLAGLLAELGRPAEARPLLERALAIRRAAFGERHPEVASSYNNIANHLQAAGDLQGAEAMFIKAIEIGEACLGPSDSALGKMWGNRGMLLKAAKRYREADDCLQRAVHIAETADGPNHPNTGLWLNNLAGLYIVDGSGRDPVPLFERALRIREGALGPAHPDVAYDLNNLASVYVLRGGREACAKAVPLLERAIAIFVDSYGAEHGNVRTVAFWLARALDGAGRGPEAAQVRARHGVTQG